MAGFEKTSEKIIAIALAVMLILFGTSFFNGVSNLGNYAKAILLLATAGIIAFEYGIKQFRVSKQTKFPTYITLTVILLLVVSGLTSLMTFGLPSFIVSATDFMVLVGASWVAIEGFI